MHAGEEICHTLNKETLLNSRVSGLDYSVHESMKDGIADELHLYVSCVR